MVGCVTEVRASIVFSDVISLISGIAHTACGRGYFRVTVLFVTKRFGSSGT
jgi:hypothetical protein